MPFVCIRALANRARRRTMVLVLCAAACVIPPLAPAAAQTRAVEAYPLESAEGRIMGFYSAALATSRLGSPFSRDTRVWSLEAALELSYVPYLSRAQRTAGFDKPEASNLSPLLPRPRLFAALPGGVLVDLSWIPPIAVEEAEANLVSAALSRRFPVGGWSVTPRIGFLDGRVQGAITCGAELGNGSIGDQVYYANVCHGRESEDYFEPRHLSLDLTIDDLPRVGAAAPYVTLGAWRETTRFDIGVRYENGERDLDHPVLEMEATRFFAAAGAQWRTRGRLRYVAELFFTPGSLATGRVLVGWRLR